jgi:RNA polymerase sigma-70 factor (ECF subfamily)
MRARARLHRGRVSESRPETRLSSFRCPSFVVLHGAQICYILRVVNLDALYREHAPTITASLARSFGARRLDLIEAAVQEAFVSAIESWGTDVPARPGAWLQVAARRGVIDALRRATWMAPSEALDELEAPVAAPDPDEDLLKMMFVCCHPAIPLESALALALRTLCGFPVAALSRALRLDEAAVEKRLIRARQVLREEHVELDGELDARLDGVLRTLYVLFLEGYSAHAGDEQIDEDLCRTAIRLNAMLLATRFATPRAHALHALFLLQTARLASRVDAAGDLIPLDRQDRARWDRTMIADGLEHLGRASTGDVVSPFHLEAAIAACHALAATYAATDWPQIVALYDELLALTPSPVIALQRAIAVGRANGARAGLRALKGLVGDDRLDDDPVLAAAIGELEAQRGDVRAARAAYRRALELAGTAPERRFLEERLAAL